MSQKTLYVSDLDGTLIRRDQTLSPFTAETVNKLVEQGMLFSYATARSVYTAGKITEALSKNLPVIVYNGTFILENGTHKRLLSNLFGTEEAEWILSVCAEHGVSPFTYALIDGEERFSYVERLLSADMREFLTVRGEDARRRPTENLLCGEIFHFVAMDCHEKLFPVYEKLREKVVCHYGNDMYSGKPWLEVHPKNATKASAVLALKEMLGCDRIVCFGDGKNDISMFEIADERYAVANAAPELKAIATAVIGDSEADAVAKWLLSNSEEGKKC